MQGERVWVASPTEGFALGALVLDPTLAPGTLRVQTEAGEDLVVKKDQVMPLLESALVSVDDMISMDELNQAIILNNLRERYKSNNIYTYIGNIIVSVNPYVVLDNLGEQLIDNYRSGTPKEELPPHLYYLAQNAFQTMLNTGQSQSVVISGESGSGKTEATKIILKFLTVASASSGADEISEMILATNPILESFGNAKTLRNENSSRFGKLIQVQFDMSGAILGAHIKNYLLESSRVVTQAQGERNYHVFYQILNGAGGQLARYGLQADPSKYRYLSSGNIRAEGKDDVGDFRRLLESMKRLKFTSDEINSIISILASILLLGNVEFSGTEKVDIKNMDALERFCEVSKISVNAAEKALTSRLFTGGGRQSSYSVPLSQAQAVENRDAFAKTIYSKLFEFLVRKMNECLTNPDAGNLFIAVLDIYGFEVFQNNSLEQFCINYANEKLHEQFNKYMFRAEQEEYRREGVPWNDIKFNDNIACIDLIERPMAGLIALMTEEAHMPKGSDKQLISKFATNHSKDPFFGYMQRKPDYFEINHYAGKVAYNINGFLDKNKNTLTGDMLLCVSASELPLLVKIFEEQRTSLSHAATDANAPQSRVAKMRVQKDGAPAGASSQKLTLIQIFRRELQNLSDLLSASDRHYVRCIKPNDQKSPMIFDSIKVLEQLKSNGIMETVAIRKAGYAKKIPLELFYDRYHFLGVRTPDEGAILAFLGKALPKNLYLVGKSKIFFKELGISQLDEKRNQVIQGSARKLQCFVRRSIAMATLFALREAERRRKEDEERRRREEEERKRREAEEKRRREEEERKRKEEEERRKREEETRRAEEEERRRREQAEAMKREQEERYNKAVKEREERERSDQQRLIDDEIARQAAEFADELADEMAANPAQGSNNFGGNDFGADDFGGDDFGLNSDPAPAAAAPSDDFGLTTADFGNGFGAETQFEFGTYVPEKEKKGPPKAAAPASTIQRKMVSIDIGGIDDVLAEFEPQEPDYSQQAFDAPSEAYEPEPEPAPAAVASKRPAQHIPAEFDYHSKFGEFERRSHAVASAPRARVLSSDFNSLMDELFDEPAPPQDEYNYPQDDLDQYGLPQGEVDEYGQPIEQYALDTPQEEFVPQHEMTDILDEIDALESVVAPRANKRETVVDDTEFSSAPEELQMNPDRRMTQEEIDEQLIMQLTMEHDMAMSPRDEKDTAESLAMLQGDDEAEERDGLSPLPISGKIDVNTPERAPPRKKNPNRNSTNLYRQSKQFGVDSFTSPMDERDFRKTFDEGEESAMSTAADSPVTASFQMNTLNNIVDDVTSKVDAATAAKRPISVVDPTPVSIPSSNTASNTASNKASNTPTRGQPSPSTTNSGGYTARGSGVKTAPEDPNNNEETKKGGFFQKIGTKGREIIARMKGGDASSSPRNSQGKPSLQRRGTVSDRAEIDQILRMNQTRDITKSLPFNFPPPPQHPGEFKGSTRDEYKEFMKKKAVAEEWENALVAYKLRHRQGDKAAMQSILARLRLKLADGSTKASVALGNISEDGEVSSTPTEGPPRVRFESNAQRNKSHRSQRFSAALGQDLAKEMDAQRAMVGVGAIAEEDDEDFGHLGAGAGGKIPRSLTVGAPSYDLDQWAAQSGGGGFGIPDEDQPQPQAQVQTLSQQEEEDAAYENFLTATIVAPTPSLLTGTAKRPPGAPPMARSNTNTNKGGGVMLPPPSIVPRDPAVSAANREAAQRAVAKPVDTSDGAVFSVLDELDAFDNELQNRQEELPPSAAELAKEEEFNPYMSLGHGDEPSKWDTWDDAKAPEDFEAGMGDGIVEDWSQVQDPWRLSLGPGASSSPAPSAAPAAKKPPADNKSKAAALNAAADPRMSMAFNDPRMSMAFGNMKMPDFEDFGATLDGDDDDDDLPF